MISLFHFISQENVIQFSRFMMSIQFLLSNRCQYVNAVHIHGGSISNRYHIRLLCERQILYYYVESQTSYWLKNEVLKNEALNTNHHISTTFALTLNVNVLLYCWVVRMCVCTSLVCRRLTGKGLTINTLCRVNLSLSVCKYLSRLGKYLEYIPKIW